MIPEQPTPYLKLCQLLNQSETEVFYQEDCDGNVLVNNPTYPLTLQCEVIEFVSEEAFKYRGKINSFTAVNVTLEVAPHNIRYAVYSLLKPDFPTLVEEVNPPIPEPEPTPEPEPVPEVPEEEVTPEEETV